MFKKSTFIPFQIRSLESMKREKRILKILRNICLLVLIIKTPALFAQSAGGVVPIGDFLQYETNATKLELMQNPPDIEGSPYYKDGEWFQAQIEINKDSKTTPAKIRYNILKQRIEVEYNDQILNIPSESILGFSYLEEDKMLRFQTGFNSDKYEIAKNQFVQLLYDGNVKFVESHKVGKSESTTPDMATGERMTTYIHTNKYFLINKEGDFKRIKFGGLFARWRFLRNFDQDKRSEIKEYAKKNDLSFKNENDIVQIIKYYDSLLS